MKKILLICLLAFVSSLTVTSCTDEVIAPQLETGGQGGTSEPMPKPY